MSQTDNVAAASSEPKRKYREGKALSVSERKERSVLRRKDTHKTVTVFLQNQYKSRLDQLCLTTGLTQAQVIERLIETSDLSHVAP